MIHKQFSFLQAVFIYCLSNVDFFSIHFPRQSIVLSGAFFSLNLQFVCFYSACWLFFFSFNLCRKNVAHLDCQSINIGFLDGCHQLIIDDFYMLCAYLCIQNSKMFVASNGDGIHDCNINGFELEYHLFNWHFRQFGWGYNVQISWPIWKAQLQRQSFDEPSIYFNINQWIRERARAFIFTDW